MKQLTLAISTLSIFGFTQIHGAIVFSEIDLDNNKIEFINTSTSSIDLSSHWLCNRVNGSPFYSQITSYTIDAVNSTASSFDVGAGEILTLNLTTGLLPDANGEMGLYNTNSFGSASAIDDYVLWGADGIRDLVAENAGIWTDNNAVNVSGRTTGETIQLNPTLPGNSASEYFIAVSSIGIVNPIPEPSSLFLLSFTGGLLIIRRRR